MKFIVQKTSLASDEMGVKIIRLQAIHDGCAFAHTAAFEFQNRDAGRGVFVWIESLASRFGVVAADRDDVIAHAKEERVKRMTTGREQGAAAGLLPDIPAELAVPRTNAVVIIDLAIVQRSEKAVVDDRFRGEKVA